MVPVGGSVITSCDRQIIKKISEIYPGRASAAPVMDLLITLLSMGKKGWSNLLKQRKENLVYMKDSLKKFLELKGESLLETPSNTISIGISLRKLFPEESEIYKNETGGASQKNNITLFGSVLYGKRVMGSRIVSYQKV